MYNVESVVVVTVN